MTILTRRVLIKGGAALALTGAGILRGSKMQAQTNPLPEVEALFFDVFGTVVDWRTGVAREAEKILKPLGYSLDWLAFADAWRAEYQPGMEEIRAGRRPFVKLDVVHRRMLDRIKPRFGLDKLDEATQAELNIAWHRLDAWPDVGPGFARLRTRLRLCPCSNGNIAIMADIGRRNDLRWHAVLGSEIAGDFKPKPRVYLASAEALGLAPDECMMVAAHSNDLNAAAALGLATAHIARPNEHGPNKGEIAPKIPVDYAAQSLEHLATQLGV
jgi:2-haloacid dehalogenase